MSRNRPIGAFLLSLLASGAAAGDWPTWRGPGHRASAPDTGLIAAWTPRLGSGQAPGKDGMLWRHDFTGRSTPIVLGDRVCANGRTGDGETRAEVVACFDVDSGKQLWERRFGVALSTVPFNRASWASLEGDAETGYLYHQGVGGLLACLDADGKVVWERALHEELGRFSGYGGRTASPTVFGDLLLVNMINVSFGKYGPPRHRYYAFDKKTGEIVWTSNPAGPDTDKNTQSTIVVTRVGERDLAIAGNADGAIYALDANTGVMAWKFQLSKRGINTTVAVDGDHVFAAHSEENVEAGTMGRVVCIDATGSGDVTKTHEVWRADEQDVGFASPTVAGGKVYVVDNAANARALDAKTGKVLWTTRIGTVGKGSPVWADGKLYVTEVNGRFAILDADSGRLLDHDELTMADGRFAEVYGSPAIVDGRIFFTTEEGIYAIGRSARTATGAAAANPTTKSVASGGALATLLLTPAEALGSPGVALTFTARGFDANGRRLDPPAATFTLSGLRGAIGADGRFVPDAAVPFQVGEVEARSGELSAAARVRVIAPLPWRFDFESDVVDKPVPWWIGTARFQVKDAGGKKVLSKPILERGLARSNVYFGPASLSGYTIEASVMSTRDGRRVGDVGLINSGYVLDLLADRQRLHIRSWESVLRIDRGVDFAWQPDVWYRMRLRVEPGTALAKVWKVGDDEPEEWTLTASDPAPIAHGSPGLTGFSISEILYDDIAVTENR